jgi:hypothetical protein
MSGAPASAYPLTWPSHKPRTPWQRRRRGTFVAGDKPITRVEAAKRLKREVAALGGIYPLISSDLILRGDGEPHLGKPEPTDPGVCVYFQMGGQPYAMACDTFDSLAQNMAAIANHIDATRRIERYGVATAAETLQAFQALPAPTTWRDVLGGPATRLEATAAYRRLAADAHPDRGGSDERMAELNAARDAALKALPA